MAASTRVDRRAWLATLTSALASPAWAAPGTAAAAPPQWLRSRLQIGVSTHFGMRGEPLSPMDALTALGVDSLRDEAFWDHVENAAGHLAIPPHVQAWVERAVASGLTPLLILNYGHPRFDGGGPPVSHAGRAAFARYVQFVMRALPHIRQFQIWNEWELGLNGLAPGRATDYLLLAQMVAPQIKAARPGALVLPAGVHRAAWHDGYLETLVRGGLLAHVDGLALHGYRFADPDPSPEAWYRELTELGRRIAAWDPQRGPGAPLYVTEMGYPAHWGRDGITRSQQADYLERCVLLAFVVPGLRGLWWYGLRDKGLWPRNSENRYGLLSPGGEPHPAWHRLKTVLSRLAAAVRIQLLRQEPRHWTLAVENSDQSVWLVDWNPAAHSASGAPSRTDETGRPRWRLSRGSPSRFGMA